MFVQKKSGPRIEASPDIKCSCLAVCASVSIMNSDDDFADEEDFTDALLGEQSKTKCWLTCHQYTIQRTLLFRNHDGGLN